MREAKRVFIFEHLGAVFFFLSLRLLFFFLLLYDNQHPEVNGTDRTTEEKKNQKTNKQNERKKTRKARLRSPKPSPRIRVLYPLSFLFFICIHF